MKRLARIGANGEPIATPSIWSYIRPSKRKLVLKVANSNNVVRSSLENEFFGWETFKSTVNVRPS